ncbi:hypothetical protein NM688_g4256 [Phlebia brevispora]|uniref:Uncharacterized protein n=1 Tax=Phlebia brevispora TaxID=194682 RepID=A0ACC1T3U1_9APHY|nr:hypothetical protein NM688_g4256 [Phlebia brevispora]
MPAKTYPSEILYPIIAKVVITHLDVVVSAPPSHRPRGDKFAQSGRRTISSLLVTSVQVRNITLTIISDIFGVPRRPDGRFERNPWKNVQYIQIFRLVSSSLQDLDDIENIVQQSTAPLRNSPIMTTYLMLTASEQTLDMSKSVPFPAVTEGMNRYIQEMQTASRLIKPDVLGEIVKKKAREFLSRTEPLRFLLNTKAGLFDIAMVIGKAYRAKETIPVEQGRDLARRAIEVLKPLYQRVAEYSTADKKMSQLEIVTGALGYLPGPEGVELSQLLLSFADKWGQPDTHV